MNYYKGEKMNYYKIEQASVKEIKPKGWIKEFLSRQMSGLTGHLDEIAFPFNEVQWGKEYNGQEESGFCAEKTLNFVGWDRFEQVAYWLDGYEKVTALLELNDANKAKVQLFALLDNADEDGYLGSQTLKSGEHKIRWPHTVVFRALITLYEESGDETIIEKLTKHYLNDDFDYVNFRDITNIEIMLWLYGKNGNLLLLEKAERDFALYRDLARTQNQINDKVDFTAKRPYNHGVTYNEISKLGAILYAYTGKEEYLNLSIEQYKKIDKYFMLPNGCLCSNEFMISNEYFHCTEMCDVSDYTWALGYMLMATANGEYADKIEKCVFNAGIGAVFEDFSKMQYLSCANQVLATETSCHNFFHIGKNWMKFVSESEVQCCLGNSNRFMPNYAHRMWMKKNNIVFACLFGESEYHTVIDGEEVSFSQQTQYPFDECITFKYNGSSKNVELAVRLPNWSEGVSIKVNGEEPCFDICNGFIYIKQPLVNGDEIRVEFFCKPKIVKYKLSGYYVERGPLVYSLGGKGKRSFDTEDNGKFASVTVVADTKWNYGIKGTEELRFEKKFCDGFVWDADFCPYYIYLNGYEIKGWETKKLINARLKNTWDLYRKRTNTIKGDFEFTPRLPAKEYIKEHIAAEKTTLKLIPLACAKMRITVLPRVE